MITTNWPAESLSQIILVPVTLWLPFAVPYIDWNVARPPE